jgi:hypothetical protein
MKNNKFFKAGVLAVLALGMTFLGCDPGNGTGDKIYTVTIGTLTNANESTITADPSSGTEGTEITLTVTSANGYHLKEGSLKYGTTPINETTKKFNLPASDVTVTATFELDVVYDTTTLAGTWLLDQEGKGPKYFIFLNSDFALGNKADIDDPDGTYVYTETSIEFTFTRDELIGDFGEKVAGTATVNGNKLTFSAFPEGEDAFDLSGLSYTKQ